jgi:hypothetical protein
MRIDINVRIHSFVETQRAASLQIPPIACGLAATIRAEAIGHDVAVDESPLLSGI